MKYLIVVGLFVHSTKKSISYFIDLVYLLGEINIINIAILQIICCKQQNKSINHIIKEYLNRSIWKH